MPVLENSKHEIFAIASARGLNCGEAYLEAYPGTKKNSAHSAGSRLLENVEIKERIAELKGKVADAVVWDEAKAIQTALDILTACPDDANGQHPLAEIGMSKAGPYYRFPSKLGFFQELNKLKKLYPKEEIEHTVNFQPVDEAIQSALEGGLLDGLAERLASRKGGKSEGSATE